MKRAPFLLFAFVLACGAPPAARPDASTPAPAPAPEAPPSETFAAIDASAVDAAYAAFEKRNPGWKATPLPPTPGQVTASVMGARRASPLGPPVGLTKEQALAKATAFVRANADLLGYDPVEIDHLKGTAFEGGAIPHAAFSVRLAGDTSQPGYERFPSVARHGGFTLYVLDDGEVGSFGALYTDSPKLHVRTVAKMPATDARIPAAVVGRPLYRYTPVGTVPGTYTPILKRSDNGVVTAADIGTIALSIAVELAPVRTYTLAYEVHVGKGKEDLVFWVHADTGALLRDPPPPDGRIDAP